MALFEPKLQHRSVGELIHWRPPNVRPGIEMTWLSNANSLTPGSRIGLKTVEGDEFEVTLVEISNATFRGTFNFATPEQPLSEALQKAKVGDAIEFKEPNIFFAPSGVASSSFQ